MTVGFRVNRDRLTPSRRRRLTLRLRAGGCGLADENTTLTSSHPGSCPPWLQRLRRSHRRPYRVWLVRGAMTCLCMLIACTIAFTLLWQSYPFPMETLDRWPKSPQVTDRGGRTLLQLVGHDDQWRFPVSLDQISPWLIQATIAAEDQRFWSHPGVDAVSMSRAVTQNLAAGRVESGASTLTMQLCRMVDDRPRTLAAKTIESIRALHLERQRSKNSILEAYLNIAPYGGNIRGVEAAARKYFGKRSVDLSLKEAALLAGLPQAPSRYRPDLYPDVAERRCRYVLRLMAAQEMITEAQRSQAAAEPCDTVSQSRCEAAAHAAWLALRQRPTGGRTTIDLGTQRVVERLVSEHAEGLPRGADVAVVVIDISTADIIALVGSADVHDPVDGQVNGVLARRSPGSALKPFIYAAAFEARTLAPDSLVENGPIELAGWAPRNFDRSFSGETSVADALCRSLNVPAILVAETTGLARCLGTIEAAGVNLPDGTERRGGLAVVVGAVEVTLLDLVNGYATLGRHGVRRSPRLFLDEKTTSASAIDANACAALNDILSSRSRVPAGAEQTARQNIPWFMWKTGTSSGRRDAWAVGHNHRFSIGVWVGRFSGAGHTEFVGNLVAEPLLTRLFSLPSLRQDQDPEPPIPWNLARPLAGPSRKTEPLRITAPVNGDIFPCMNGKAIVHPQTNHLAEGRWFLNGLLISGIRTDRLLLDPGDYELRCVNPEGEHAAVRFRVE